MIHTALQTKFLKQDFENLLHSFFRIGT